MTILTVLNIDTQNAFNIIMLILMGSSFLITYNKAVKNRVSKEDIKEMKDRFNDKDRAVHHRIDGIEKRIDTNIIEIQKDIKQILMRVGDEQKK